MTSVKIYHYAYAKMPCGRKYLTTDDIVLKVVRTYRKMNMSMVYYEENIQGNVWMNFIERSSNDKKKKSTKI